MTILAIAVAVGAAILLWPRGGALTADPVDAAEAGILVDLTAKPAHLMPGEPTHLTYQLTDAATGQPVGDLASNRGRAFRVLMISTDLSDLRPITAHESAPGVFHVLFTPSVDTHYVAYALFSRDGLQLQDLRHLVSHSGRIVLPNLRTVVEGKVVGALGVGLLLSAAFQPSK